MSVAASRSSSTVEVTQSSFTPQKGSKMGQFSITLGVTNDRTHKTTMVGGIVFEGYMPKMFQVRPEGLKEVDVYGTTFLVPEDSNVLAVVDKALRRDERPSVLQQFGENVKNVKNDQKHKMETAEKQLKEVKHLAEEEVNNSVFGKLAKIFL